MARTPRARSGPAGNEDHTRLEDFWDEPPAGSRPAPDGAALQGAWRSVGGRRQAEFLISGTRVAVHFADGEIYMGSFTLGNGRRPGTMDVRVEEGPTRHKGLVALCIYEVDGDTLRWCTASPGQTERPRAFAEADPQHLCLVFRREHHETKH